MTYRKFLNFTCNVYQQNQPRNQAMCEARGYCWGTAQKGIF